MLGISDLQVICKAGLLYEDSQKNPTLFSGVIISEPIGVLILRGWGGPGIAAKHVRQLVPIEIPDPGNLPVCIRYCGQERFVRKRISVHALDSINPLVRACPIIPPEDVSLSVPAEVPRPADFPRRALGSIADSQALSKTAISNAGSWPIP